MVRHKVCVCEEYKRMCVWVRKKERKKERGRERERERKG